MLPMLIHTDGNAVLASKRRYIRLTQRDEGWEHRGIRKKADGERSRVEGRNCRMGNWWKRLKEWTEGTGRRKGWRNEKR